MELGHMMRGHFADAWLELNLTIAQFKCLFFIDKKGCTNQKGLAEVLGVTPPNVTGILDRLVEQKLVIRQENENNRRMQVIELTPKAKTLLSELKAGHGHPMMELMDSVPVEDLKALLRGLKAVETAAKKKNDAKLME
jgi:DNA-binding MarR family transcriptional regulator